MARRTHRSHLLDIYGIWIHLATDPRQWRSLQRHFTSPEDVPTVLGFAGWRDGDIVLFVDLGAHTGDTLALVDTVAHEATHAAGAILDHVGEQYDGTSEALAYLVGWLTKWVWQHISTDLKAAS